MKKIALTVTDFTDFTEVKNILDGRNFSLFIRYGSQCGRCTHFNDDTNATCPAFPNGVPDVLLEAKETHETILEGQEGDLVFDPKY